jgi:oligopeptide/dipeptide ABC transporter ATP-binding protein
MPTIDDVLRVVNLKTEIVTRRGLLRAVDGVSFNVPRGETVGLVGESGCGKTTTCLSLMRLMPERSARIVDGQIWFGETDLVSASEAEMRSYRGRLIAMITQDALAALNPVLTVGNQVEEPLRHHLNLTRDDRRARILDVMAGLKIARPSDRLTQYPHQLSGGTRQRVVAAMGLATFPQLVIADEPTTALDVTTQAQFLLLIREIQRETGMSVLWVTHDLGVTAQVCDRVNVMYAGRIVESGDVHRIFAKPRHPYTIALMKSVPTPGVKQARLFQIEGQPPDLADMPPGCAFANRCQHAMPICRTQYPPATRLGDNDYVHCWFAATNMPGVGEIASEVAAADDTSNSAVKD